MTVDISQVRQTENGFVIRETEAYAIELWPMLYNWRLILSPYVGCITTDRGFCYFGRDFGGFSRALIAGLGWDDPYRTDPEGYDKKAFG